MTTISRQAPLRRLCIHLAGIFALMWPALINGQPFFFPDTTAYVRAADLAVQIASGHRIRTAWSRPAPAPGAGPSAPNAPAPATTPAPIARGSDGSNGTAVMAGRSPYFGMLLYIGYVFSDFWLFVLAQALVAWWLIGLALRCFACTSLRLRLGFAALLALLSPLPVYVGLLIADALAGFGILAFLILLRPPADLRRWETPALIMLMIVSAASHLTHIVMFAGMAGLLGLGLLLRWIPRAMLRPLAIAAGVAAIGLLSVFVTGLVVRRALGQAPAAAPVMTARFITDGPGRDFIAAGCGGRRFAACGRPVVAANSDIWLWDHDPRVGGFLTADPATRAALSREDSRFALAVLAAYPLRQTAMIARNTLHQLTYFEGTVVDEHCVADFGCGVVDLPPTIRARMLRTPAAHDGFPSAVMADIQALTVAMALVALVLAIRRLQARDPEAARLLLLWLALLATAMLINALLGGGISRPQGRYQERIVWLVPLLAMLAGSRAWGDRTRSLPAAPGKR